MTDLVIRSSRPAPLAEHFSPARLVRTLWENRELTRNFAAREVLERHKGALLGVGWNIISPILTLVVYTIVFGYIFGSRWGKGGLPDRFDFPITFFAGLTLYQVFAECVNRAPTLVSSRSNLVRKVVFPLEILPVTAVWAALIHAAISIGLLLVVLGVVTGGRALHWQIVLLPLVVLPVTMLSLGFSWVLAAIGVFIRDVRPIVVVCTQLLMFMTPLFYRVDQRLAAHPLIRAVIENNPMTVIVDSARRVMLWGEIPDWVSLGWVTVLSVVVMVAGFGVFSLMRRSMADVH